MLNPHIEVPLIILNPRSNSLKYFSEKLKVIVISDGSFEHLQKEIDPSKTDVKDQEVLENVIHKIVLRYKYGTDNLEQIALF